MARKSKASNVDAFFRRSKRQNPRFREVDEKKEPDLWCVNCAAPADADCIKHHTVRPKKAR